MLSLILTPSLDANILKLRCAEGVDERTCKTGIGEKRHVKVDRGATDLVAVAKLRTCEVFRDVDNHIDGMVVQQIESLGLITLL